ncbi:HAD-IB family hydrolase [Bacillaceae bacterium IKA-2]|jgi:HAD superfamily hydrolase (TIGR01490 family)|nr:HAD-IB family hydrolase [Bacillaceae bacterium IKA-2]
MKVAIFDFDGTLYPDETFPLMMEHLKKHPIYSKKYRFFITKISLMYAGYKCKFYSEQKMKEYSMRSYISSFQKNSKSEIDHFFVDLGTKMSSDLSKSVLQKLEQHHKDGYYIMLVSGAFLPLLEVVAKNLPIDCLIGTSIPYKNKQFDNKTPVMHVHGELKKDQIYASLANDYIDWENSFAYGDSFSDLGVLELVGNPIAVKPEPRLLEIATIRKWEVM